MEMDRKKFKKIKGEKRGYSREKEKQKKGKSGGGRAAPLISCGLLFASLEHNNKRVVFKRTEYKENRIKDSVVR